MLWRSLRCTIPLVSRFITKYGYFPDIYLTQGSQSQAQWHQNHHKYLIKWKIVIWDGTGQCLQILLCHINGKAQASNCALWKKEITLHFGWVFSLNVRQFNGVYLFGVKEMPWSIVHWEIIGPRIHLKFEMFLFLWFTRP